MKKIAFVSDSIYPYHKGGKEKRFFDISTRLAQKGYDVHIYTMQWWDGDKIKKENGVTLHAISPLYPLYSGGRRSIKEGIMFGLSCFKLFKEDWDVIDVDHMPHLVLFPMKTVCLMKKKRLIVTWNEVWGKEYWQEYLGKMGIIAYFIEKISSILPDEIISISEHTTQKLRKDLTSKKKIHTIPVGIDISYIQSVKPSSIKSDVIFAGRLLSHKNVDILIKAIALLKETFPNIKCIIIGDGPERKKLEKLTSEMQLEENVMFLGFIEKHSEVYSLMKSSRVFVLPSTREGFGIVVIEANACGIPVIAINHKENASKDLIEDGRNGFISDQSEQMVAEKIRMILDNNFSSQFKTTCTESVEKYEWSLVIDDIERIYLQ